MRTKYFIVVLLAYLLVETNVFAQESVKSAIDLGNRRELFVDDFLIAAMENAEIRYHEAHREREYVVMNKPWEGNGCGYSTFLYDDVLKVYRRYFHSRQIAMRGEPEQEGLVKIAMIESQDGIHWERPNLGLVTYQGNRNNNLLFLHSHDFSPFIDKNPKAKPEARYKAIGAGSGLTIYQSPDGVHWKGMPGNSTYPKGDFDSQNLLFWSEFENKYIMYYRIYVKGCRTFGRAVSDDCITWEDHGPIVFPEGEGPVPEAQFYTVQIKPYERAPHIYLGFPARYVDNGMTESTKLLPEWEARQERMKKEKRLGTAVNDCIMITSRDGLHFRQATDVFLRPGLRTKDNWAYHGNFMDWGFVILPSQEKDSPPELNFYNPESVFTGRETLFRRYTLRIDGFGSLHANRKSGSVTTKPLTFDGKELSLNYRTTAAGSVFVEIQDPTGKVMPGFSRTECDIIFGDSLDRRVSWKGNRSVETLKGKPIVLKFYLKEADIYALKFE